jgi:AcrR family transcriptional regulator
VKAERKDRRTERTRAALLSSFIELVLSRGYEDITVEDVVSHANVGRSTFYMHFKSKEALLKRSLTHPSLPLAALVDTQVPPQAMVELLDHFRTNRRRNRVFFTAPIRAIWVQHLAEMIEPRLVALSRTSRKLPLLPLPLAAQAIAEAQIGLVIHWLLGRTNVKIEAVAEALTAITKTTVAALLT